MSQTILIFLTVLSWICISSSQTISNKIPSSTDDIDDKFVEAVNEFAIEVYKKLVSSEDGNLFFCPICLASSLSLLMEVSGGKTRKEMGKILSMKSNKIGLDEFRSNFEKLHERMKVTDCLSRTANGLFLDEDYKPSPDLLNSFSNSYNTEIFEADFSGNPQQAAWNINDFVRTGTGGIIKRLLDRVEMGSQLLLVSAVHLGVRLENGTHSKVKKRKFFNQGVEDNDLYVPAISKKKQKVRIADSYDFRALELPCSDSLNTSNVSVWILLPHKVGNLAEIEYALSTDIFHEINRFSKDVVADICIPKIRFQYFMDLSKDLQRLGLNSAFSANDANFSGLTEAKGIHLTGVLQRTSVDIGSRGFIHWDNKGDEQLQADDETVDEVFPFQVDHPFLFCVIDNLSGVMLYMGRVFEF